MHEMGIAASVIEAVEREMTGYPGRRAAKVGLRVGELAGVDAESVRFCFEALVRGTQLSPLELAVEACKGDELDFHYLELEELAAV